MNFAFEYALSNTLPVLWVDTTYSNMVRYIQIYLMPLLKLLPDILWSWDKQLSQVNINKSFIDFKSAERPANIEGFSYGLVILNEAGIILRNKNLWLESIAPMLLDYKESRAFIGGTPKGKRYRNGKHFFYELYTKAVESRTERYSAFNFSTYDNPLIDLEEVRELESDLPKYLRAQEIYGKFVENETGEIIKSSWWRELPQGFNLTKGSNGRRLIYQSWDTAFKKNEENDYSVCTTWAVLPNMYVLIDAFVGRLEFPELKKKFVELADRFKPVNILVEDKASGQSLIQEIQRNTRLPIKPIKPVGDKIARVNSITPLFESGRVGIVPFSDVEIPDNTFCNDADDLSQCVREYIINECADFPNGEHDDAVDSMSQFLIYAKDNVVAASGGMIHVKRKLK
jgi:predicted phage terminase large subunit-like protein